MNHRAPHPSTGGRARSRGGLLALLLVAQLMVILDISAVNVALPDLARDLGIARGDIGWAITSYSLIFGSLLLLGGRAADLLGRRRMFLAGLTVFTASSLASAAAGTATVLFASRAGQGLGAAMLSPAALSIITSSFRGSERAKALGAWGAVGGAGAAIGVLLGGLLTQLIDWRAIFFINIPIGIALAVMAWKALPSDPGRPRWGGLDLPGAVVATGGLGALLYAASQAGTAGWTSAQTLGIGASGLLALAVFAAIERRSSVPLLRVERLVDRAVGGGFLLMLVASSVMFGTFLMASLYLQNVLGTGPLLTGLGFVPLALTAGIGAHLGSHVVSNIGVRIPLAVALAVTAGGMLLLSGVDARGSYVSDVLPGILVAGLGIGVVLASVALSVLAGARDEESGMLSGLNSTGHEVGGSFGIAALTSVVTASTGPAAGIANGFLTAGVLAAVGSVIALLVLPPASSFLPKLRLLPSSMPIH